MNSNNLIAKVASLTSRKMDGDFILLCEQYLNVALEAACKFIALNKPTGHEKLLKAFSPVTTEDYIPLLDYNTLDVSEFYPLAIIMKDFYLFYLHDTQDGDVKLRPVNTLDALSLAEVHGSGYYFLLYPLVYINTPAKFANIGEIHLTHYKYLTIAEYPDELEEYLIAELLKLVSPNVAPNTNE